MLKIRFKDNKYNSVWLVEPKITIGRSATNALVVDDPVAADVHLEVLVDNENLTLRNLIPARPVQVNGALVNGACALKPQDVIVLGAVELVVIDPKRESRVTAEESAQATQLRPVKPTGWSLKANHAALGNRVVPLKETTVIGRASECDISLPAAHLSRRHAQLHVIDGLLFVKDLGSANGTFLNGKQVMEARVKRGDELRFDTLVFGVLGPVDDMAKTTVRKMPSHPVQSRAEPSAKAAGQSPDNSKLNSVSAAHQAARVSSRGAQASKNTPESETHSKGKFGLLFLGAIAAVVITTLILTRK